MRTNYETMEDVQEQELYLGTDIKPHVQEPVKHTKYIILPETKKDMGDYDVYRIKAIKDFGDVKAGDIGGWVGGYNNLEQEGNCWIYDEAEVTGDSVIMENAIVCNNAKVSMQVPVNGNAVICDNAEIVGFGISVSGNAVIADNAQIYAYTDWMIEDETDITIHGNAMVFGNVSINGTGQTIDFKGNDRICATNEGKEVLEKVEKRNLRDLHRIVNNTEEKYGFTGITKEESVYINDGLEKKNIVLKQIIALKDFSNVKAGTVGGWIENESNLSQENNCWITEYVRVYDNAQVSENAYIDGNVTASDNAVISGNAKVNGGLEIELYDNVVVSGNAYVHGHVYIHGNSKVCGHAEINGENVYIYGNAWIGNHAKIFGNAIVGDSAAVYGHAHVHGQAHVNGNAEIFGHANIEGNAKIFGDNYKINTDEPFNVTDVSNMEHKFFPVEIKEEYENTNARLRKGKTCISGNVQVTGYALIGDGVTLYSNEHISDGFYNGTDEPRENICGVCYVEETKNWDVCLVPEPVLDENKYYIA